MAASPTIDKSLKITSGRICFGALHNIWAGAYTAPVNGLPTLSSRAFGTVKAHPLEFNLPALNGTWHAYRLIDLHDTLTTAWLVAHSSVDPVAEIDRIVRVSGAPWDSDSGSSVNNDDTRAAGILVVNRYDWGYYHSQYWDEIGEGVEEGGNNVLANSNSLGIVDFASAKDTVTLWQGQKPSEREWTESGGWLYIPFGEYMFGRFGYDEAKTAAQSFFFFARYTEFTRTAFAGTEKTLKVYETTEEIFARRLRDGYDFSGIELIRQMATPPEDPTIRPMGPPAPPIESCFGPYERADWVLDAENIEALRAFQRQNLSPELMSTRRAVGEFVEPWVEPVYELINELALSYLEHTVVPRMANLDIAAASAASAGLFPPPDTREDGTVQSFFLDCFTKPDEDLVPGFDYDAVTGRIKSFLSKFEKEDVIYRDECVVAMCRLMARIFTEVFEAAGKNAVGYYRDKVVPWDVRLAIYHDRDLLPLLQFSRVYWEGRA